MRIIKQGKMPKCVSAVRLKCNECGTVFEADEGEYETEDGGYNEILFCAVCPFCKEPGYKRRIYIRGSGAYTAGKRGVI